jgi:hypothetical protein
VAEREKKREAAGAFQAVSLGCSLGCMGWLALLGPRLAQLGCLSFFSELFPFSILLFLLYLLHKIFKFSQTNS